MTMEFNKGAVPATAQNKKKRGFTLTEIAIVLGIVGLILGAIWVAAAAVYTNLRTSKTSTQLLNIVQNVRAMYATSGVVDATADMTTLGAQTTAAAKTYINAGVFPADMLNGPAATADTVQNAWNGNVAVTSATGTTASDSFSVTFSNVPQQACITILTSTTGNGRDPGLFGVNVGNAVAPAANWAPANFINSTSNVNGISASAAQAICAANTRMAFFFKLK